MCGGICGPAGEDYRNADVCPGCRRARWMCNCLSAYSAASKQKNKAGIKKRVNKNRKLTKPLRKK